MMAWWSGSKKDSHEASTEGPSAAHEATAAGTNPSSHVPTYTRQAILDGLQLILKTIARVEPAGDRSDFNPDADLYDSGYLDSLSASQFLILAEKQYGVELPDWLIGGKASSLSALAAYIESRLAAESG